MITKLFILGTIVLFLIAGLFVLGLFKTGDKRAVVNQMRQEFEAANLSCSTDEDCVFVNICDYTCSANCKYVNKDSGIVKRLDKLMSQYDKAAGDLCKCGCTCNEIGNITKCVDGQCVADFWGFSMVKEEGCKTP